MPNIEMNFYIPDKDFEQAIAKGIEKHPDYVLVVRCKDCSHAIINENHPNRPLICCLTKMCGTTRPEWFCADGERKDNGI